MIKQDMLNLCPKNKTPRSESNKDKEPRNQVPSKVLKEDLVELLAYIIIVVTLRWNLYD